MFKCLLFRLLLSILFVPHLCFSQFQVLHKNDSTKFRKSHLGIEATASVLPGAKITRLGGKYELRSTLQSSYDLGINYLKYINQDLRITTGLHFVIGKRNFFFDMPSQYYPNGWDGRNYIEDKELWGSFRIPLLIEKRLARKKFNETSIKVGLNFRYSGLMSDEGYGSPFIDSSNKFMPLFHAELSARNDGKPWVTFLGGVFKSILLDNKNILSIGVQADISTTYFLKCNYEFIVANQPVSTGTYKINGSSLGLSVQYIFTGSNKQLVKQQNILRSPRKRAGFKQLKKEDILKDFVFKGNHIQFNFAMLSTFKAQLKNISGSHPVNTSATPGLLLSFKYQKNFNNKFSLITGAEATLYGRDFNTSFSKNDFSPPLVSDYNSKSWSLINDLILSLPVMIEKRWPYSKTKFLFADVGVRLNFSLGADIDIYSIYLQNTNNVFFEAGGVYSYSNNDRKPWLSFPINAGHSWLLKNNNLLQLAVCSNISFTKYVNGSYWVDIPNQPLTEGKYSSTGSFIGLSFNYVFTNANFRIRKAYEKN